MPLNRYIKISIANRELELTSVEDLPMAISYSLEDRESFQQKGNSKALSVVVPATTSNGKVANTFHNPAVEDLTSGQLFRGNRRVIIEGNGQELLVGKAFLTAAEHTDKPTEYEFDFYGNNADWSIDLKEATLFDFLRDILFVFTKDAIINSWNFDGTNPLLPYVFAPVRYGAPMETYEEISGGVVIRKTEDFNMDPTYMRPALSKYWIIYRGFKSLGYRVQSDFFDTEYFRRQVMPWTWGNFLESDGTRLDNLDFLAKSDVIVSKLNTDFTGFWDLGVTNDSINGAFDNNDSYEYNAGSLAMEWTYLPAFDYGLLSATFHLNMYLDAKATANSEVEVRVQWFKNGVKVNHGDDNGNGTLLLDLDAPAIGSRSYIGNMDDYATFLVVAGDVISAKIYLHTQDSGAGRARIHASVDAFELDFIRIPLGGTINFENYTGFKKWKFLDFLGGVIDEFNLCIGTDPVNKVVYFEPQHPYSLEHDQSEKDGGYFNGTHLDWSAKQDLSKKSRLQLFSDYERELSFKYKDDPNDGTYNIIQNRNVNKPAMAKYVLPDRFKAGKKEIENRFFSAVIHTDVIQWQGIAGGAEAFPQMLCLVPENISNTSRNEAQNTFEPKSAYYKGVVSDFGWMFDKQLQYNFPYMFAVNYKEGGEEDPILSYCDEQIGPDDTAVTGIGLLRRFFLQRLEIMRNGQYYKTYFHLNNKDFANFLHREHIIVQGQKYELVEINNYDPLSEESTECFLRKWSPVKH